MSTCTEMAFFPPNFILQQTPPPPPPPPPHDDDDDHHQPPTSLPPHTHINLPQHFHGVGSFLGKRSSSMSFTDNHDDDQTNNNNNNNNGDQEEILSEDEGSLAGEKKRRLNMEQVRTLEKNFELGNKLEPERKMQLARSLGLQPRQIAIWFQNRRARWKTKQLEKDYDLLKRQFDAIKAENDALLSHNQKLQSQIMALKNREQTESTFNLNIKETEGCSSNRSSENNSDNNIKLDISMTPPPIDSPSISAHHHHQTTTSRPFFPPSNRPTTAGAGAGAGAGVPHHLFHNSSRTDQTVKDESLSNMFCGIDDQTPFWPWLDQSNFN